MNLAERLALLLAVPLVAFLTSGRILDLQLAPSRIAASTSPNCQLPSVASIGNITRKHAELRVELRDYLLAPTTRSGPRRWQRFEPAEKDLNQLLDQYADTLISDEQRSPVAARISAT